MISWAAVFRPVLGGSLGRTKLTVIENRKKKTEINYKCGVDDSFFSILPFKSNFFIVEEVTYNLICLNGNIYQKNISLKP